MLKNRKLTSLQNKSSKNIEIVPLVASKYYFLPKYISYVSPVPTELKTIKKKPH